MDSYHRHAHLFDMLNKSQDVVSRLCGSLKRQKKLIPCCDCSKKGDRMNRQQVCPLHELRRLCYEGGGIYNILTTRNDSSMKSSAAGMMANIEVSLSYMIGVHV